MVQVQTRSPEDILIIGAGHNALVTAGYLARAGRQVLVLERRPVVGGACVTEELFPGFRVSSAAYLCSLLQPKIIADLELEQFGYQVLPKDPAHFSPFPDGRHLFFWRDRSKTVQEIARFSKADAESFPDYEKHLERLSDFVQDLLLRTPPDLPPGRLKDLVLWTSLLLRLRRLTPTELRLLVQIMTQSVSDFLDRWFESEEVKVCLATDGVIGTNGGPLTPGTAYVLLHHTMGGVGGVRGLWGFVRGGMGALTEAMAASARSRGGRIRTEAAVQRILVRDNRVEGVVLGSGEEIRARTVVSGVDPKRTFLQLVEPSQLDPEFRELIEGIKMEGCSFKLNLAVDRLPDFTALPGSGPQHRATIHFCPSLEYMERAWDEAKFGHPSRAPMVEMTIPTLYDPSLAPEGKHILSLFVQYAPYRLREGSWRTEGRRFAERVIDLVNDYAPGLKESILGLHFLSPLDLEEQFGLTGGNIFHGEMSLDQLFCLRPVQGWAQYRTPIQGLYLCGSGTHPGGGVMGAAGHNAAREILQDL